MPKTRRTPKVETRLSPVAHIQFDQLCRLEGKTKTEMARRAILWYMEHHDRLRNEEIEGKLEQRLSKIENRLAGLLVRLGIDIGTIYSLLWIRSDPATRKETFLDCYTNAVRRMKNKLRKEEQEIRESMGS